MCLQLSGFFFYLHLLSLWNVVSTELMSWSRTATQYACDWARLVSIPRLSRDGCHHLLSHVLEIFYLYYILLIIISYLAAAKMCFIMAMTEAKVWGHCGYREMVVLTPMSFSCLEASKPIRALNFVGFLLNLCPTVSMAVLWKNLYVVAISPPGRMKALNKNTVFCLTCFMRY